MLPAAELQERLDRFPESVWILDVRRVPAIGQLDQLGARYALSEFVGEGGRRCGVAQADHDQRRMAEVRQLGAHVETSEGAAGGGEVIRPGGAQRCLAFLRDLGSSSHEVV